MDNHRDLTGTGFAKSAVIGYPRQTYSLSFKERVRGEVIYNKMNIHWYGPDQSNSEIINQRCCRAEPKRLVVSR